MRERDVKMTVGVTSEAVGGRVAEWLQKQYPRGSSKRVARDFACSPNTVKKWLAGARPENKHFDAMFNKWGTAFLSYVYGLAEPWSESAMEQELDDLRARLDRLEGRAL